MDMIRLLVIDDHPVINEGLPIFFENYPELMVVGTARDGLEGLEKLRRNDPDVIILDLVMPKLDGIEAIRLYLQEKPGVGIVVFTGHKNDMYIYQALEAGARGYVLKGNPVSQVVDAIREVRRGRFWLSPELNQSLIGMFLKGAGRRPEALDIFNSLSPRERQVFRLLAKGKSTTEVADILCISPKTVAKHRVAIKTKLDIKNVAEMANYAARIGLIELDLDPVGETSS